MREVPLGGSLIILIGDKRVSQRKGTLVGASAPKWEAMAVNAKEAPWRVSSLILWIYKKNEVRTNSIDLARKTCLILSRHQLFESKFWRCHNSGWSSRPSTRYRSCSPQHSSLSIFLLVDQCQNPNAVTRDVDARLRIRSYFWIVLRLRSLINCTSKN